MTSIIRGCTGVAVGVGVSVGGGVAVAIATAVAVSAGDGVGLGAATEGVSFGTTAAAARVGTSAGRVPGDAPVAQAVARARSRMRTGQRAAILADLCIAGIDVDATKKMPTFKRLASLPGGTLLAKAEPFVCQLLRVNIVRVWQLAKGFDERFSDGHEISAVGFNDLCKSRVLGQLYAYLLRT